MSIHLLTEADADELLTFEKENRSFFAATLPDRGDEYYTLPHFRDVVAGLVADAMHDRGYIQLVGRVPGHFQFHGVWEDSVLFSKANPNDQ